MEAIMLIKAQRTGIGIAVVVAIGLIWSVAVMSKWVPVASAEMRSAAVIQPLERTRRDRSGLAKGRQDGPPTPIDAQTGERRGVLASTADVQRLMNPEDTSAIFIRVRLGRPTAILGDI
jgi:hypothetical protein